MTRKDRYGRNRSRHSPIMDQERQLHCITCGREWPCEPHVSWEKAHENVVFHIASAEAPPPYGEDREAYERSVEELVEKLRASRSRYPYCSQP